MAMWESRRTVACCVSQESSMSIKEKKKKKRLGNAAQHNTTNETRDYSSTWSKKKVTVPTACVGVLGLFQQGVCLKKDQYNRA